MGTRPSAALAATVLTAALLAACSRAGPADEPARPAGATDVVEEGGPDSPDASGSGAGVADIAGFAATRPAVAEELDDPSTYAANRRVEIVHGG